MCYLDILHSDPFMGECDDDEYDGDDEGDDDNDDGEVGMEVDINTDTTDSCEYIYINHFKF